MSIFAARKNVEKESKFYPYQNKTKETIVEK
jgi:hypothetical protein